LQPSPRWSFAKAQRPQTTAFSHSYHRYPAKFIPQLVNKAVVEYTQEGDVVCDPFGGCGTTLVEAKLLGRKSIGFDINPVAKLITDTKIRAIPPSHLELALAQFNQAHTLLGKRNHKTKIKPFVHSERIYYWFTGRTVNQLDRLYSSILSIQDRDCRRFFLCAFSHILKNCSRWLMKSIKPTIHPDKQLPNPKEVFLRHLDSMIKKNDAYFLELKRNNNLRIQSKMRLHDSTKRLPLADDSVNLIVTSPPYVTSYEYADLHQLSLLWFGDDTRTFKSWEKYSGRFNQFRQTFVGSSFKSTKHNEFGSAIAEDIVHLMEAEDRSLARSIARYFVDMNSAFAEMYRILKPKAKAVLIIGNTEMHEIAIRNAEVATQQLEALGFKTVKLVKREVTNKMITPWRDKVTGKFTGTTNRNRKRVYLHEYVVIVEKI
jgi:DNA modification methylase